ncbi:MAG: Flp pilus assembly protein CpaB [Candidatus Wallbacteria bacterium]
MNRRFLVAIFVGIMAILVAMNMGPKQPAPPEKVEVVIPPAKPVSIFRANQAIKPKTEITAEMFKKFDTFDTDEAYIKLAGKGMTSEVSLIGKIAVAPIKISDALTTDNVSEKKPFIPNRLSEAIPVGKRAITIGVGVTQSVGGFIKEGDYVDLVGIFNDPAVSEPIRTILSGVMVLSIGSELPIDTNPRGERPAPAPNPNDPNAPQPTIKATPVQQLTFAATPEEAEIITLITESRNKVSFILLLRSKKEFEESEENAKKKSARGDNVLSKKEALDIFMGKNKADKGNVSTPGTMNIGNMQLNNNEFDPEKMGQMMKQQGGMQPQGMTPMTPAGKLPGAPLAPVDNTVEMYKGINKTIINVK